MNVHKEDGESSPPLSSPADVLPLWHSTINLWNKEGGTHTETPATFEGNKLIGLFPQYSAVTECDNYTFSFPTQPPGDGRFSIPFAHFKSEKLLLMASYESWRLEKKSSCFRFAARIHIKLLQFTVEMLVALCKYCHHWPAEVVHLNLWALLSCQQTSCLQSLLHIFCCFASFQAETVNITITCDLAQPSV